MATLPQFLTASVLLFALWYMQYSVSAQLLRPPPQIIVTNQDVNPIEVFCAQSSGTTTSEDKIVAPGQLQTITVPPIGLSGICRGMRNGCESILYAEDKDGVKCRTKCFSILVNTTGVYRRNKHLQPWKHVGEECDDREE